MTVDRPAFVVRFPVVVNLVVNISSAVGRHGGVVKPQGLDNVRLATADVSSSVMQQSLGETAMVDIKGCRLSILRLPFSYFTCPTFNAFSTSILNCYKNVPHTPRCAGRIATS